jgi:hypothetical protein
MFQPLQHDEWICDAVGVGRKTQRQPVRLPDFRSDRRRHRGRISRIRPADPQRNADALGHFGSQLGRSPKLLLIDVLDVNDADLIALPIDPFKKDQISGIWQILARFGLRLRW